MPNNYYVVEGKYHDADDLIGAARGASAIQIHRKRIEPWLAAIFQAEHFNLLIGSGFSAGLSHAAGVAGAGMGLAEIHPEFDAAILGASATSATRMGRGEPNIEDQFRSALALRDGLEVQADQRLAALDAGIGRALAAFAGSIVAMEKSVANSNLVDGGADPAFERLLSDFLLTFASRTASRDRLHIFTTNYDRMIEHGFDMLGLRPIDRFVGALSPIFRASRFDVDIHYAPPGSRGEARPLEGVVRFTKLHGSVDWRLQNGKVVRSALHFGGDLSLTPSEAQCLMVYPNSSKDIETAFFPYAELFRDFSAAICRPNSAILTYGYGFGDDHVNRIIADMLTLPSTHLVIVSFDDPGGRIARFMERVGRSAQISVVIGPQLAALEPLVTHYLPKPSIDTITQRRSELVNRRGVADEDQGADR